MRKPNQFELGALWASRFVYSEVDQPTLAFEILRELVAGDIDPNTVDEHERSMLIAFQADQSARLSPR